MRRRRGWWPVAAAVVGMLAAGCESRPPIQTADGQPPSRDLYQPPAPDTWRPPPDQWVRPDMSLPPDQWPPPDQWRPPDQWPLPDQWPPQPDQWIPDAAQQPLCVPKGIKSPCYTIFKAALISCACSSTPGATITTCLGSFSSHPYYQAALALAACIQASCSPWCVNGGYDAMFTCGPTKCKAQAACCLADGA